MEVRRGWVYQSFYSSGSACDQTELTLRSAEEIGTCRPIIFDDAKSGSVSLQYVDAEDKVYSQQYSDTRCRDRLADFNPNNRDFNRRPTEVRRISCMPLDTEDPTTPVYTRHISLGPDLPVQKRSVVNLEFQDSILCIASSESKAPHMSVGSSYFSAYSEVCVINEGKGFQVKCICVFAMSQSVSQCSRSLS